MKQRIRTIVVAVLCIAVSAGLTVATFRTPSPLISIRQATAAMSS